MTIEVGMHTGKHRIKLTLSSEDVETHAWMTDNEGYLNGLVELLRQYGTTCIEAYTDPNNKIKNMFGEVKLELEKEATEAVRGKERTKTRRNPRRR